MGAAELSRLPLPAELTLAGAFVATLAAVTLTDLDRRVIPNRIVLTSAAVAVATVAAVDSATLVPRVIAASAAAGFLLPAALARPDGMGLGDVKLAAIMGLYLEAAVAPALVVAFAAGAVAGAALIVRDGAVARKRKLPFAPFLALGGLIGLGVGNEAVSWYLHAMLQ
jgi:leader peptidase (prepilin peptidase)/N-methyltransferase